MTVTATRPILQIRKLRYLVLLFNIRQLVIRYVKLPHQSGAGTYPLTKIS